MDNRAITVRVVVVAREADRPAVVLANAVVQNVFSLDRIVEPVPNFRTVRLPKAQHLLASVYAVNVVRLGMIVPNSRMTVPWIPRLPGECGKIGQDRRTYHPSQCQKGRLMPQSLRNCRSRKGNHP